MSFFETSTLIVLCGLGLGFIMGATARAARFCTFGAIEDYVLSGRTIRLKAWALAIAVAMICVQVMHATDIARIEQAFYLGPSLGLAGAIFGGFLFGLGMAMVGTCGYGVIVRMAGGDLRALVGFLVLGFSAYMAARGLTSLVKTNTVDRLTIDLSAFGGQGLPHLISGLTGLTLTDIWLPTGLIIGGAIITCCLMDVNFRKSRTDVIAGVAIGMAVAGGFLATGTLGADPFNEVRVHSFTYVLPVGETLVWLMTFSGSTMTFPIAVVVGTFCGAALVAIRRKELRLESFDDPRDMGRNILGAAAMGTGGITALGCTVGQGISGVSTLAISPMFSLISIFVGAAFGLNWLLTGSAIEACQVLFARRTKQTDKVTKDLEGFRTSERFSAKASLLSRLHGLFR